MPQVTKDQTTKALNMRTQIPNTRVAIQCMEEEFVESKSSGNFCIHRTWQVISAPELTINGDKIDLLGNDMEEYKVTKYSDGKGGFLPITDSKVKKGLGYVFDDYKNMGLEDEVKDGFDNDNPPLIAKGKVIQAMLASEEIKVTEAPTPEEAARGVKYTNRPKKDAEGKPEVLFKLKIAYKLGPSDVAPVPF